jgi:hypothetical protein
MPHGRIGRRAALLTARRRQSTRGLTDLVEEGDEGIPGEDQNAAGGVLAVADVPLTGVGADLDALLRVTYACAGFPPPLLTHRCAPSST